jgi:hypothetical protein
MCRVAEILQWFVHILCALTVASGIGAVLSIIPDLPTIPERAIPGFYGIAAGTIAWIYLSAALSLIILVYRKNA